MSDREYGVFNGHELDRKSSPSSSSDTISLGRARQKPASLCTDKDTFKDMARGKHHQLLNPLREALSTLGQMRLNDLQVGADGRNRCALKPFWAMTGRNQPSSSQYIFGNATWYRGLIKPRPGRAIMYADWKCQEIGIEAGSVRTRPCWKTCWPPTSTSPSASEPGVLPDDATKETHGAERGALKTVALGVGYGMQEQSLAVRLAKTCPEARELLQLHRRTFPRFWQWNDDVVHYGKLHRKIWTTYGWELNVRRETTGSPPRSAPCGISDAGQRQRNATDRLLPLCRARWTRAGIPAGRPSTRRAAG